MAAAEPAPVSDAARDKPPSRGAGVPFAVPTARLLCGVLVAAASTLPCAATASLSPVLSATSGDTCAADEGVDSVDVLGRAAEPPVASAESLAAGPGALPGGLDSSPAAGLSSTSSGAGFGAVEAADVDARGVLAPAEEPSTGAEGPKDVKGAADAREGPTLEPPSPDAPAAAVDTVPVSTG